jgi:hypothetical protein
MHSNAPDIGNVLSAYTAVEVPEIVKNVVLYSMLH